MSNSKNLFFTLALAASILTPIVSHSRDRNHPSRSNLYSDDDVAYSLADKVETQYILGAGDLIASALLFKSAFSLPNALKLKQEVINVATDLDIKKLELDESKKIQTLEDAKVKVKKVSTSLKGLSSQHLSPADFEETKELFIKRELGMSMSEYSELKSKIKNKSIITNAKKKSLISSLEKQIGSLNEVQKVNKGVFAKILGKNGIKIRTIKLAGSVFFALEVTNRIIVWNLLNDFPGYIVDIQDIKNIAFNLFGIGDWEIGEDDGSRAREL